jgi:hypothetical protein
MHRVLVATLFGLCVGVICATGAFAGHILKFTTITLVWILLNRAVMGFVIGASGFRLHWAWNGILMGLVVGSIFSYFLFMTLGAMVMPSINFLVNGVFGLLIEFFTSVVCKQPAFTTKPVLKQAVAA